MAEDDSERQADALNRMTGGGGSDEPKKLPPPVSAAMFRQARPLEPGMPTGEADRQRRLRPQRPAGSPAEPSVPPASDAQRLGAITSAESDTVAIYVPPPANSDSTQASPSERAATRALERKRTVIPILLTCGALLATIGAIRWIVDEDSAFRLVSAAMSLALLGFGGLLLFIAILNMLQVRDQIAAGDAESPPGRPRAPGV